MSVQAVTWALSVKTGSPSAKAVLLALANYAGVDGDAYPSQERLSEETEQSVDSVQRRLRELEALGLVFRKHRFAKRGTRRSNEYIVLLDDRARDMARALGWDGAGARFENHAADCGMDGAGDVVGNPREKPDSMPQPCGVGPCRKSEASIPQNGGEPCRTVAAQNPNLRTQTYTPLTPHGGSREGDASRSEDRTGADATDARWERFRAGWSFDLTELPEHARRVFLALSEAEQELALRFAPAYLDECRSRSRKVAHAKTRLSGKGWQAFEAKASAKPEKIVRSRVETDKGVFIRIGSPQAAAWLRYEQSKDRSKTRLAFASTPFGIGCYRPSEWPPPKERSGDTAA